MFVFVGILLFVACTGDNVNSRHLKLSTNLQSAGTRTIYGSTWEGGETVIIHLKGAKNADGSDVTEGDYPFTTDKNGNLTPSQDMYWPEKPDGIQVYAWTTNLKPLLLPSTAIQNRCRYRH
jgi:hypothetical protein